MIIDHCSIETEDCSVQGVRLLCHDNGLSLTGFFRQVVVCSFRLAVGIHLGLFIIVPFPIGLASTIAPLPRQGHNMGRQVRPIKEARFGVVAMGGGPRVSAHLVSFKEERQLTIPTFQHGQDLIMGPVIHVDGPDH